MVRARAGSDDGGGLLRLLRASGGLASHLELYKAMRGLLWSLWGLIIQYANGNPSDDLLPYAQWRLERCKARIGAKISRATFRRWPGVRGHALRRDRLHHENRSIVQL